MPAVFGYLSNTQDQTIFFSESQAIRELGRGKRLLWELHAPALNVVVGSSSAIYLCSANSGCLFSGTPDPTTLHNSPAGSTSCGTTARHLHRCQSGRASRQLSHCRNYGADEGPSHNGLKLQSSAFVNFRNALSGFPKSSPRPSSFRPRRPWP